MLVLARKSEQTIVLDRHGERIATVQVLRIANNRVRLGIVADEHVRIFREELLGTVADRTHDPAGGSEADGREEDKKQ